MDSWRHPPVVGRLACDDRHRRRLARLRHVLRHAQNARANEPGRHDGGRHRRRRQANHRRPAYRRPTRAAEIGHRHRRFGDSRGGHSPEPRSGGSNLAQSRAATSRSISSSPVRWDCGIPTRNQRLHPPASQRPGRCRSIAPTRSAAGSPCSAAASTRPDSPWNRRPSWMRRHAHLAIPRAGSTTTSLDNYWPFFFPVLSML